MSGTDDIDAFVPQTPFHMVWIATDLCNARCAHCSSNSSLRSDDELTTREACDLMSQLADAGVVDVAVSGGEPLLRRDLFDVIEHARRCGLSVGVGSNGASLPPDKARRLAHSGVGRFQVSLDGPAPQHDALRRWPGLFDRAVRSIETAQRAGLRVHVCCTINRLNYASLAQLAECVHRLGVARLNFSRYVPTGRGTDDLDLPRARWKDAIAECQTLRRRYAGRMQVVTHLAQQILVDEDVAAMPGFVGCQAGRGQGAVTANGTVLPCVLLPVAMGNIRERSFEDIWRRSPVACALRRRDELSGACASCNVRAKCGGCRAVAYAATGSLWETDPRCWLPAATVAASRAPRADVAASQLTRRVR